jgi:hypothetical protein
VREAAQDAERVRPSIADERQQSDQSREPHRMTFGPDEQKSRGTGTFGMLDERQREGRLQEDVAFQRARREIGPGRLVADHRPARDIFDMEPKGRAGIESTRADDQVSGVCIEDCCFSKHAHEPP